MTVSLLTLSILVLAERLWIEGKMKLAMEHSPVFCVDEFKHALMEHVRLHERKKKMNEKKRKGKEETKETKQIITCPTPVTTCLEINI